MKQRLAESRLLTVLALIAVAIGAIDPFMGLLPKVVHLPLVLIGAVVAACGRQLVQGDPTAIFKSKGGRQLLMLLGLNLIVSLLVACGAGRGIYTVAVGLDEGITVKRELAAQNQISPEVELSITRGMLDVDRVFIQVTDTAQCFEVFTNDVKQGLITSVDSTLTTLDRLNEQGVLHIKSENGKRRYTQWMSRLRLSAIGIRTALVLIPARTAPAEGQPTPSLTPKEQRALDELRAWCKRASEQLRRNEDRLKEDLTRLGASDVPAPADSQ